VLGVRCVRLERDLEGIRKETRSVCEPNEFETPFGAQIYFDDANTCAPARSGTTVSARSRQGRND
jgi:hypothetical protein